MNTHLLIAIVNFISLPIGEGFIPKEKNTILLSSAGLEITFTGHDHKDYFNSITFNHRSEQVEITLRSDNIQEHNSNQLLKSPFSNPNLNKNIVIEKRFFNTGFYKIQFVFKQELKHMYVSIREV